MTLIDKDNVKNALSRRMCNDCAYNGEVCYSCDVQDMLDALEDLPVIDAKPVVHGEWVEEPYLLGVTRRCNVCGENYGMPHGVFNYCPNCGADMRGD